MWWRKIHQSQMHGAVCVKHFDRLESRRECRRIKKFLLPPNGQKNNGIRVSLCFGSIPVAFVPGNGRTTGFLGVSLLRKWEIQKTEFFKSLKSPVLTPVNRIVDSVTAHGCSRSFLLQEEGKFDKLDGPSCQQSVFRLHKKGHNARSKQATLQRRMERYICKQNWTKFLALNTPTPALLRISRSNVCIYVCVLAVYLRQLFLHMWL